MPKQWRQFIKDNNQICWTIREIPTRLQQRATWIKCLAAIAVCGHRPAIPGSNPKHTVYALTVKFCNTFVLRKMLEYNKKEAGFGQYFLKCQVDRTGGFEVKIFDLIQSNKMQPRPHRPHRQQHRQAGRPINRNERMAGRTQLLLISNEQV